MLTVISHHCVLHHHRECRGEWPVPDVANLQYHCGCPCHHNGVQAPGLSMSAAWLAQFERWEHEQYTQAVRDLSGADRRGTHD